jgi:hypothetical protein
VRRARLLAVALFLLLSALIAHAADTTVTAILGDPARYDGLEVTIRGTASSVNATTSRKGNDYTTFQITDVSGAGVTVFSWGRPSVTSGGVVRVTGIFRRVKRVSGRTFYNEIGASRISPVEQR